MNVEIRTIVATPIRKLTNNIFILFFNQTLFAWVIGKFTVWSYWEASIYIYLRMCYI